MRKGYFKIMLFIIFEDKIMGNSQLFRFSTYTIYIIYIYILHDDDKILFIFYVLWETQLLYNSKPNNCSLV